MAERVKCPVCNSLSVLYQLGPLNTLYFYECPVCGRYEVSELGPFDGMNINHLSSYLFYHHFLHNSSPTEYRYHTTLKKELCDQYKKEFDEGNNQNGHPVHMDGDIIENWYPKSFSERIDYILLLISSQIKHVGQQIVYNEQEAMSLLFVDRKDKDTKAFSPTYGQMLERDSQDCRDEAKYMLDYLQSSSYIEYSFGSQEDKALYIRLTPKGYERIDQLQKNSGYGKNALVAMKFGDDTKPLREAIRQGIQDAGYLAVFIDEVQHLNFITPELLKHIRDSKFVVADLTHQNNGAYFEEGYAMGLGKPVIQLCKNGVRLHFDIAQKNTIIWETESDIPERLTNRIKATID